MRLTIIKDDNFVSIDGVGIFGVDLSQLNQEINAVQWYDSIGNVEIRDINTNNIISNVTISNIDDFQFAIDNYYIRLEELSNQVQEEIIDSSPKQNNNVITTTFEEPIAN
jgi:hypothetical protein